VKLLDGFKLFTKNLANDCYELLFDYVLELVTTLEYIFIILLNSKTKSIISHEEIIHPNPCYYPILNECYNWQTMFLQQKMTPISLM
jgi:hypothetical protein